MKILLAVDGSDYTKRMLAYAAVNQGLFGTGHDYLVVTAVPQLPVHATRFVPREVLDDYYKDEADKVLGPVEAFAAQQGWNVRSLRRVGNAAAEIATVAAEEKPDLIVLGSHGHGALAGAVMGSVASGVLARTKTPVLLVR